MILTDPASLPKNLDLIGSGRGQPPTCAAALLVSPHGFRVNEQSASDNPYMSPGQEVDVDRALRQHAALADRITELGVPVVLFRGREGLDDAVYPNNVFASARRRFIIGHMRHPVRQAEARREDVRRLFTKTLGYELWDLSRQPGVAELTGALVIDRRRTIGFCGLSGRADIEGCHAMHDAFGLVLTLRFELAPGEYHTNMVLAVLAGRACVIHPGSFADPAVPDAIIAAYGHRAVVLSDAEKAAYAGNCLAITREDVLFSQRALDGLRATTRARLESLGFRLHGLPVDELEKGGGSLRCLIAEIF